MAEINPPPSVCWAQRKNFVFVTFNVECKEPAIEVEPKSLSFKGMCLPEHKINEVKFDLYDEIVPGESKWTNKGRCIEMFLVKKDSNQPFWPNLTSGKLKHHWLKVDFARWLDESDTGSDDDDIYKYPKGFTEQYGLDDRGDSRSSSDEEDLPNLE